MTPSAPSATRLRLCDRPRVELDEVDGGGHGVCANAATTETGATIPVSATRIATSAVRQHWFTGKSLPQAPGVGQRRGSVAEAFGELQPLAFELVLPGHGLLEFRAEGDQPLVRGGVLREG